MNQKIQYLREKLKAQNLDGMIVSNLNNIFYLTNIQAEGVLLITRKENIFLTDSRYIEEANSKVTISDELIIADVREYVSDDYENFFMFCENVGIEENSLTYAQYQNIQHSYKCNNLVETEYIIEKIRMVKEEEEIEKIKKACEITDKCFSHLLSFIKKGMTEKEIALEIEMFFRKNGAEDVSFKPIVASGENSSKPHSIPTDRKIGENDIILIDMGCKYDGYCSDMTRTIFVDKVPDYIKSTYDMVLENQNLVLNELKDGKQVKDLALIVENNFGVKKYSTLHALGHGIGLEPHEIPAINTKSKLSLKENMVVAIEPGAYQTGNFGVRIEDTVLIKKNTCIELTKSEKNYIVI